ncbi:hypothetical protein Tco_0821142 [Tanacetum coccineum]|uniref:Uncharacterized protein n=1 Tax=Tanacetum coccineum TaxID=301880 RepID=A0ABQ5AFM5_9ASTR
MFHRTLTHICLIHTLTRITPISGSHHVGGDHMEACGYCYAGFYWFIVLVMNVRSSAGIHRDDFDPIVHLEDCEESEDDEMQGVTNAYSPNQRRSLCNISRSLNGKHKRRLASRKRKKTSSHLHRNQGVTRGRTKLPRAGKIHTSPRRRCKKASKVLSSSPYSGRNFVQWQVLADFLAKTPSEESEEMKGQENCNNKRRSGVIKYVEAIYRWSFELHGSRAGLMLVSPKGKEYTYALRFEFKTTINEAEYEALLAGQSPIQSKTAGDQAVPGQNKGSSRKLQQRFHGARLTRSEQKS